MLASMNADGIILTRIDEKLLPYVEATNIPMVSDHYQGGRLATEHLLECGCAASG